MPKQRGILGFPQGKRPSMFTFTPRNGDEWPSDDSDSDFSPNENESGSDSYDSDTKQKTKAQRVNKKKTEKKRDTKKPKDVRISNKKERTSAKHTENRKHSSDNQEKERKKSKKRSSDLKIIKNTGTCSHSKSEETERTEHSEITSITWNNMPIIIVERIFHFVLQDQCQFPVLFRLSSVCRLWYKAARRKAFWKDVNLSKAACRFKEKRQFEALQFVLQNFAPSIRSLNLTDWETLHMNTFQNIAVKCENLQKIILSNCVRLNSVAIEHLAENCPNLRSVDFTGIAYPNNKLHWLAALEKFMVKKASVLEELILSKNFIGTYSFLQKLLVPNGLPSLKVIDFSNCVCSTSHHVFDIRGLQQACPKLESFRLVGHNFSLPSSDEGEDSPGFPHLQELSIAQYDNTARSTETQNKILTTILKNATKLRLLDIRGRKYISTVALVDLCCSDVEYLYLCGCSDDLNMQEIAQKWGHSLVELDLSASKIFAQGPRFKMCCAASKLLKIQTIDLSGTDATEEDIKPVLRKCPTLQTFKLDRCRRLPRGMKQTFDSKRLVELRDKLCSGGSE